MKTRELLETSEKEFLLAAASRMLANLGIPDVLRIFHTVANTDEEDTTVLHVRLLLDSMATIHPDTIKQDVAKIADLVVNVPMVALRYAYGIDGPWPRGEAAIATNASTSCKYAENVIKGPWPPGEAAIAKDAKVAVEYARDVIKGPWPPGEAAIAKDAKASHDYALVTRRRFKAGEPVIMANHRSAFIYARDVIKKSWPEANVHAVETKEQRVARRKFDRWIDGHDLWDMEFPERFGECMQLYVPDDIDFDMYGAGQSVQDVCTSWSSNANDHFTYYMLQHPPKNEEDVEAYIDAALKVMYK